MKTQCEYAQQLVSAQNNNEIKWLDRVDFLVTESLTLEYLIRGLPATSALLRPASPGTSSRTRPVHLSTLLASAWAIKTSASARNKKPTAIACSAACLTAST